MWGIITIIWIVVGSTLWGSYLATHSRGESDAFSPPQKTLIGAMMWPFYLGLYVFNHLAIWIGLKPKIDDE